MIQKAFVLVLFMAPAVWGKTKIIGSGSTFVYPIMSKWISEYHQQQPDTDLSYEAIGSGGGVREVCAGTVDFGATDVPMTDKELAACKIGKVLQLPIAMGAVVPAYNIPGITQELKFTPEALVGIFLGRITNWDDPQLAAANPGVNLPNLQIILVHRSDGSGTTYIWTDYLSGASPEWKSRVGANTAVKWPIGLGGKGNEGVVGLVRQLSGTIGYVELAYAVQNRISFGSVRNSAGNFVRASAESIGAAAAAVQIPADFRYSMTNASGKDSYPISGTTWMVIPIASKKGGELQNFADWVLTQGQDITAQLAYARLPQSLIAKIQSSLRKIK